ncbi:MAG: hydroxyacylglutathione hydrolase [Acidobacteriota bacterium]|nr:hydroxyacylglutathione hydrolase [Acidobacteriota bacterium]
MPHYSYLMPLFKQFYLPCLAHASYVIASNGEAAIVDPRRDVDEYIEFAREHGLTIRYVIETHLHADFVSGHRELAERTGAEIVFGARAAAELPHRAVRDGDVLRVGALELRAMETPGHTPESISWLIIEDGVPRRVLTGDTLFIGDVGRPDLAGSRGFTSEQMASMLYDSLHEKLLALPDDVEVWPAHGAGSACGRNISKETSSTIGVQRRTNHALAPMSREEFVNMMTTGISAPPAYFPYDAELNRRGARPLAELTAKPLAADEIRAMRATILDVRDAASFGAGHVASAVNIGLDGQFASWCGTLLRSDATLVVFAASTQKAAEAVMRLARIGYENVAGYTTSLDGFEVAPLGQMSVAELHAAPLRVVDVRGPGEYSAGHVPDAINIPLPELSARLGEIDRDGALAVICAGGYRSSAAASLLAQAGFAHVINVAGGTSAWVREGFATDVSA